MTLLLTDNRGRTHVSSDHAARPGGARRPDARREHRRRRHLRQLDAVGGSRSGRLSRLPALAAPADRGRASPSIALVRDRLLPRHRPAPEHALLLPRHRGRQLRQRERAVADPPASTRTRRSWPAGRSACGARARARPSVGDITGDGSKEIVAGNDHLYAWNCERHRAARRRRRPADLGRLLERDQDGDRRARARRDRSRVARASRSFVTVVGRLATRPSSCAATVDFLPGWPRNPDFTTAAEGLLGRPRPPWTWTATASRALRAGEERQPVRLALERHAARRARRPSRPASAPTSRCSPVVREPRRRPATRKSSSARRTARCTSGTTTARTSAPSRRPPGTACSRNTAVGDVNNDGILDVVMLDRGRRGERLQHEDRQPAAGLAADAVDQEQPEDAVAGARRLRLRRLPRDRRREQRRRRRRCRRCGSTTTRATCCPAGRSSPAASTSESSPIVADVSGDGVAGHPVRQRGRARSTAGIRTAVDSPASRSPSATSSARCRSPTTSTATAASTWCSPAGTRTSTSGTSRRPTSKAAAQWPTLKHDVQRSGLLRHRIDTPTDVGGGDPSWRSAAGAASSWRRTIPNPFNPMTRIEYGVPVRGGEGDGAAAARHLRRAGAARAPTGATASRRPGTIARCGTDATTAAPRVGSGIYFYRLRVGGESVARKLLLLQ